MPEFTSPLLTGPGLTGLLAQSESPAPWRREAAIGFAMVLSMLLHVGGYYWWGERAITGTVEPVAPYQTQVSLRLMPPAPITAPVEAPPVVQPDVSPSAVPQRVTKSARPAPDRREPRVAKPSVPAPSVSVPKAVEAVVPEQEVRSGPTAAQLRAQYFDDLFAHIERHKFYPDVARRQGLEASVQVSFVLSANGAISDLMIDGGPKLLRHAAAQTLQSAAPLPTPPADLERPLRVEYLMAFALH